MPPKRWQTSTSTTALSSLLGVMGAGTPPGVGTRGALTEQAAEAAEPPPLIFNYCFRFFAFKA